LALKTIETLSLTTVALPLSNIEMRRANEAGALAASKKAGKNIYAWDELGQRPLTSNERNAHHGK
jgi:hypothetical protein